MKKPAMDTRVTQRSCGDRPHSHQPKVVLTGRFSGTILQRPGLDHSLLRAKVRRKLERKRWESHGYEEILHNLFRSSTLVTNPAFSTKEIPPQILPAELRAAIQTINVAAAPGSGHVSAYLLSWKTSPIRDTFDTPNVLPSIVKDSRPV
ncbi:unnamed protein product [Strongylus vulgaris]|uniref:Uncharacterized protein n=1 Tax=Strongylus vulgaris TaxID=40348 RepID=A0A3P7LI87_STRVU|nr:unnamed protein product [Strongylus vulgaris]